MILHVAATPTIVTLGLDPSAPYFLHGFWSGRNFLTPVIARLDRAIQRCCGRMWITGTGPVVTKEGVGRS